MRFTDENWLDTNSILRMIETRASIIYYVITDTNNFDLIIFTIKTT